MANLFTSQTPSSTDNSDGSPGITTATTVQFAQGGTVSGIRFYATATVGGTYTAALWHVDTADSSPSGTLLASKTMGVAPTAGTWNTVTFDTPVSVSTSNLYRAAIFSGAGRYVATANFFTSPLVNGDITAEANGVNPVGLGTLKQGTFVVNASLTYPSSEFNSTSYFVDVEFSVGTTPISLADGGTASEALAVSATVPIGETGSGSDSSTVQASVPLADTGSETEGVLPAVSAPLADGGTASDVLDNGQSTPITLTDRGRAVDSLIVVRRGSASDGSGGGWESFGAMIQANIDQLESERTQRPTMCPTHFYPLDDARGVLHCMFGGEIFDYTGQQIHDFRS